MDYIPDNYDMWEANERQIERRLSKLPKCMECGEPITSEKAYRIERSLFCQDCFDEYLDSVTVYVEEMEDV